MCHAVRVIGKSGHVSHRLPRSVKPRRTKFESMQKPLVEQYNTSTEENPCSVRLSIPPYLPSKQFLNLRDIDCRMQ